MRMNLVKVALATAVLTASQLTLADASGRTIGVTCFGCHGYNGISKGAAPSLHGLPAEHIAKTMQDFRSGARPATIMQRIAKGYTDGEIDAMAAWLASQK